MFQIIIYHNISDKMSEMASAAGGVGAGGVGDLYGELADTNRTIAIQDYLSTKIISPERLLFECMEVHLMSVPQTDILTGDFSIDDVFALTSAGNHATIVCTCADNVGSPEGRITAILEGEALPSGTGVTTRRYDQAVGVAQPLFNHSVDRLKELFVLGNHETDISLLLRDWNHGAWANFTDKIMEDLNVKGINAGREAFKDKLKVLFEKIRALKVDDPNIHELRRRYCIMAMDLLRNDLFQFFGPTIQKGLLATINIHNTSDDYLRHHGKPVIPGSAIEKAPYNLLILVNFVIGGHVYTIHIGIDREAVKELLFHASRDEGKNGDDKYQSVSYWIGDVIKWIHDHKDKFFSIMRMVLDKSLPKVASVAAHIGIRHKKYLLDKMDEMLVRDQSSTPSLDHAIFVSGCKCFTLYHPELLFCNVDDSTFRKSIIITTPNTDMTVGVYRGEHFVSVKPIIVKLPITELTISNIMFTLPPPHGQLPLFHVPTYSENDELLDEVLKPSEGDSFGSFQSSPTTPGIDSLKLQAQVVADAPVIESEDDATEAPEAPEVAVKFQMEKAPENADSASIFPSSAAAKAKAPAPPKAPAKKAKAKVKVKAPPKEPAPEVAALIEEIKDRITRPQINPELELVKHIVSKEVATPGILKQALNAICGTFHYLLSPFTSLQRLGVTPHTELLDPDTAMRISIVLMCALNYSEKGKSIYNDQMELSAAELEFRAEEREFRAAEREFRAAKEEFRDAKRKLRDAESLKPVKRMVTPAVTIDKLGRVVDVNPTEEDEEEEEEVGISNQIIDAAILHMQNMQKEVENTKSRKDTVENRIEYLQSCIRESEDALSDNFQSVTNIIVPNHAEVEALRSYNPVYKEMILDRNSSRILVQVGGMRRRTLRRGVKKNTRRERRCSSIRSRCSSRRWQCRSSSGKLKKNTQRCRSRNSKTRRRRTTAINT